ncbi:hypothetical protein [uncultured Sphingomonas sp.]|uniref:hypothetical protein n=1 Tax=uncultured Sphingomonas sp. TaxID=158754 RepID=UPI00260A3C20|nr:hypothetical protein [uncultured Sphingomonas sp.]
MANANDFAVDFDATDPGHDAWLRAKVVRGLAESRDRAAMISVDQVLNKDELDFSVSDSSAGREAE